MAWKLVKWCCFIGRFVCYTGNTKSEGGAGRVSVMACAVAV